MTTLTVTRSRKKQRLKSRLPYSTQWIDRVDRRMVDLALRSEWITQGPRIQAFERRLAEFCGAPYAVAVSSGTAALHLACQAAGVHPGSEVITSPISFVATANSVIYCGGTPEFSDVDEKTGSLQTGYLGSVISKKTVALLPVHYGGYPCDPKSIHEISEKHRLVVIEDACHALGAEYRLDDRWFKVGSTAHSDLCVFSFHPVKSITTGEGGAITTSRKDLYEKLLALRNHGVIRENSFPPGYYEMRHLGFNYRITDIQCALGMSQLKKLTRFIARRRELAAAYQRLLSNVEEIELIAEAPWQRSSYHLFVILLRLPKLKTGRDGILKELIRRGIGAQVHYIPIPLQPYYRNRFGFQLGDFPRAECFYARCLSMPLFPKMKHEDVRGVVRVLKSVLSSCRR